MDASFNQGWIFLARGEHQKAIDFLEKAVSQNPKNEEWQRVLSKAYIAYGKKQQSTGQHREALISYEKAINICLQLFKKNPSLLQSNHWRFILQEAYEQRAASQEVLGQYSLLM